MSRLAEGEVECYYAVSNPLAAEQHGTEESDVLLKAMGMRVAVQPHGTEQSH